MQFYRVIKTIIMKKITFTILFYFISLIGFAQQKTITGKILNERKQPIEFVNVILKTSSNATPVKGTITNAVGEFSITIKNTGSYILYATLVGYATYISDTIKIDSATTVLELAVIEMKINYKTEKEVVVTAKKKFIEIQADKTVLNIENNLTAVGNSAFELIKKAPAVTVDKDDNLKLKGSLATIFVDGKPFYLSGEQLTQYLKNLQADAISKIEIIGNPSSKFDAAGQSGIINIRLKKNKQFGTNGTVTLGTGYGRYPKVNTALSLNHRNKFVNIFSDASLGYSESFNKLTYNSIIGIAENTMFQDRENYWHPKSTWGSFKLGADFSLNKKTIIGFLIRGNSDHENSVTDNETIFRNYKREILQSIITQKTKDEKTNNVSYNVNLKKEIDSLGSEISFDADYIVYNRKAENINYNNFKDALNAPTRNPYTFRNGTPANINIKTAKLDFTKVIDSSLKIETGAKLSQVQNDNFLKVDSLTNTNTWTIDYNRTNTFLYTERIVAGYFNFTKDWKKVSLQMGVRAENTYYKGNSVTLNQVRDSNYTNLFPSVFLTYRLNDNNTFNGSYSRRIYRPSYQSLNPFIDFIDPFTRFEGNPNLKPSYTNSFELKHSFKNFLYSTLSYSNTKAQTTNVILQDKNTGSINNITANVGTSTNIALNFSFSVEPKKWWSMENNISFSGGKSKSNYPGYEFNQNAFGIDLSTEQSFKLPKKYKIQMSAYYSTPYKDGITNVRANYLVSAGFQKSVLAGKGNLKFNFNNIIGPSSYRAKYLNENLNIKWVNQWEGRRVSLSFNYKFGNKNVKASRQRSAASQDEKNRVNL